MLQYLRTSQPVRRKNINIQLTLCYYRQQPPSILELKNDRHIKANDLPLVNQVEINTFFHKYHRNTIAKFQGDGAALQSYRSLGDSKGLRQW